MKTDAIHFPRRKPPFLFGSGAAIFTVGAMIFGH
jgi:hypothetical protein